MKVAVIAIGDEILIGQVLDSNSYWLNQKLNDLGLETVLNITIGDVPADIKHSLDYAFKTCDLIFLTGGLGPTKDDKTKEVLANYFGTTLIFNQPLYDRIKKLFEQLNIPMSNNIYEQCHLPQSAQLLTNNKGTAPGMLLEKDGKKLISMPGVPYEMKDIFEHEIIPMLSGNQEDQIHHWTLYTAGISESIISQKLEDFESALPDFVSLAYLPSIYNVRLRLSIKADKNTAKSLYMTYEKELYKILGNGIHSNIDRSLSQSLGELLIAKKQTLAVAESCTGGYLSHLITAKAGSSIYYNGGVVAYQNYIKEDLLNVPTNILKKHGAVSAQTVEAMVVGTLKNLKVDCAIAISGIAGPGGGTEEKPVGTIYVAWGNKDSIQSHRINYAKDRSLNIQFASNFGLNSLRLFLLEQ